MNNPRLGDLIQSDRVLDLEPAEKPAILRALCEQLGEDPRVLNAEAFYNAILRREDQASTGVGLGVAIPHVKIPEVTDYVIAVGRVGRGVDFAAIDGKPVHLVFMIGASDRQTRDFVKLLAQITRMLKDESVRRELIEAPDAEAFVEAIRHHEPA